MAILFKKTFSYRRIQLYTTTQKGDRPPPVPKDERDISVDLVNNEANHFALYLYVPNNTTPKLIILCQT